MPQPRNLSCLALALLLPMIACKRDRHAEVPDSSGGHGSFVERDTAGSSPTPVQVCEHLARMIAAEIGQVDPEVQAATINECVGEMMQEQQLRGPKEWDLVARCVLSSHSEADIDRCDQLYPGYQQPSGVGAREEQACIYMISMVLYETGTADVMSDAELQDMMAECLQAFDEDRQAMNSSEYEALVGCIINAQTVAQMEQCGN